MGEQTPIGELSDHTINILRTMSQNPEIQQEENSMAIEKIAFSLQVLLTETGSAEDATSFREIQQHFSNHADITKILKHDIHTYTNTNNA